MISAFQLEITSIIITYSIVTVVVILVPFNVLRWANCLPFRLQGQPRRRLVGAIVALPTIIAILGFLIVPGSFWIHYLTSNLPAEITSSKETQKFPLRGWQSRGCDTCPITNVTINPILDNGVVYVTENGIYIDRLIFSDTFYSFADIQSIGIGLSSSAGTFVYHPNLGIHFNDGSVYSFFFPFEWMYSAFYNALQNANAPIDNGYFENFVLPNQQHRLIKTYLIN